MGDFVTYSDRFRLVWTPFLKKQKGKQLQAVGVICPPVLGAGGDLKLKVDGQTHTARKIDLIRYPVDVTSQDCDIVYLWLIPRPSKLTRVQASWKTTQGMTHRASLQLKPAEPTDVHVIFKTHIDLGYTHRAADVLKLYQTTFMESLLEKLDATADRKPGKGFTWTLSTWLLEQCLDEKKVKPDLRKRFEQYIKQGRINWGLMPFTTHSEFFGLEEMCRSVYGARRLAERFDRPVPTAAKMTDVPAHTAALAMAFAAAGGKFFQIGTNPESRPPEVPPVFWWKLPDGNRMLTHYHSNYGTPLLPHEDWPYQHWLSVQITSDNIGPQTLGLVDHIAWIDEHFDYPKCKTGTLEDFADGMIAKHTKDIPELEEDFTDWWIHGIASQAEATGIARLDKDRLPNIETVRTLIDMAAGKKSVSDETVRKAYEQLSLYTEHTWGDHATDARKAVPKGSLYTSSALAGSGKPKSPIDRWVTSWEDKANYVHEAHKAIEKTTADAINAFRPAPKGKTDLGIVLFNALSWARGGVVELEDKRLPAGDFELIDPTTGGSVLYERNGNALTFVAPKVPPCGYLTLQVRPVSTRKVPGAFSEWYAKGSALHSEGHTFQFHEKGGLARWHDRMRSYQWCSGEVEHPMGTYLYEMPGSGKLRNFAREVHSNSYNHTSGFFHRHDYADMSQFGPVGGSKARITPSLSALRAQVTVEAACPQRNVPNRKSGDVQRYRTTFTHYRGLRDLFVSVELIGKRATYAAEAGYAYFPFFGGGGPEIMIERIAHQMRPDDDLGPGVNAGHMVAGRGVRVECEHAGMNFYPMQTPLVSFNQPGAYFYDENTEDYDGVLYATLFNNCWGTNFAQWQSGNMRFDFVCQPTGNDDWDGGLSKGGAELFRPLVAAVVPFKEKDVSRSLCQIDTAFVHVVTMKPADFTAGTVIRLWNADVDTLKSQITLPTATRGAKLYRCDLLERPQGKPITISSEGVAKVTLKPNEIVTLLLANAK